MLGPYRNHKLYGTQRDFESRLVQGWTDGASIRYLTVVCFYGLAHLIIRGVAWILGIRVETLRLDFPNAWSSNASYNGDHSTGYIGVDIAAGTWSLARRVPSYIKLLYMLSMVPTKHARR